MQVVSRLLNSVLCDLQQSIWSISYTPYGILKGKNDLFGIQLRIFTPAISTPTFQLEPQKFPCGLFADFSFQLIISICFLQTFPLPLIIVLLNLCVASSPVCTTVYLNQRQFPGCDLYILCILNILVKIQPSLSVFILIY